MKPTLLQVGKQAIFLQDIQDLPHCFHVTLSLVLNVDKDVIQIHDNDDIELLCQDLVDTTLEAYWDIRLSERHHLVLELTISDLKSRFLLVTFLDPHLVVSTSQIQLGEPFCLT